jgi:putative heme iron utilization protein
MPATPRFKINDRVNKKRNTGGISLTIDSTAGTIIEMEEKLNSRKRPGYYYNVKWPDGRTSEHAQHILVPAP